LNKHLLQYVSILCTFLASCSGSQDRPKSDKSLPDKSTVTLTEIARVSQININEEVFFTGFRKLLITSGGNVIVSDWEKQALFYFDRDGNFVEQIGRKGRGPGEFTSLRYVLLAPGDTLHTFDRNNARHQIFARIDGSWKQVREHPMKQKFSEELHAFYPEKVFPREGPGYRALFRNNIGLRDTASMYYEWLTPVDVDLQPLEDEKRLLTPAEDAVVIRDRISSIINSHPNGLKIFTEFDTNRNQIHRAYNNDATIRIMDLEGEEKNRIQLPYEMISTDTEQKEQYLRTMRKRHNSQIERVAEEAYLDYQPFISQFVMDNQSRYWVQVSRRNKTDPDWLVVNSDGTLAGSFRVQDSFETLELFILSGVRDNRLYGYAYTEDGEALFVIWEATGI